MLDKLALLVHARARVFAIVAAVGFVVAGRWGRESTSDSTRTTPADASTESAIADARLERAGYFGTDVVVLVRDDPRGARAWRR